MTNFRFALVFLSCLTCGLIQADEKPNSITIATWNLEWFFDANKADNASDLSRQQAAPSQDQWIWKVENCARVIAEMKPTILALQEVENRRVVRELAKFLSESHRLKYRVAFIEGYDGFTDQDVAIMYRGGLVQFSRKEQSLEMFRSKEFYNLNKHIFATFEWGEGSETERLTVLNVHLRAKPERQDIRIRQCKLMRRWLDQALLEGRNVVAVGDFNTEEMSGKSLPGSDIAALAGWNTKTSSDDLVDLNQFLQTQFRDTHISGKQFDRIFCSQSMTQDEPEKRDLVFSKILNYKELVIVGTKDKNHFDGFYKIPQNQRDVSDHYPIMAEFVFQ